MKRVKILLAMILVSIVVILPSCEKDEPAELKGIKLSYGDTLEIRAQKSNNLSARRVMSQVGDTLWPLDADGNPIKMIDPITGQLLFIEVVTTEVTVAQQYVVVTFSAAEGLVQEKGTTITFFNQNPDEKIYVSFPKDSRIISRTTEDGKRFQDEMENLNNIRQLLVDNTTHTLSQEIGLIHTDAEPTWITANKEDFIDQMLDPKFSKSAKSKSVIAQVNALDEQNIELVTTEIIDLVEKGEKLNHKVINRLAKKLNSQE
ncbi:TPA: hypothetical protein DIC40_05930 [Patescibacteria group bacterium]|nr:hypothetical protein P148_SR1C00001G0709 [candidate division SR1 bacterium RAAC1_SR1_1]HCY21352.1 hypothetical protein [Candidatus Gracilibacteria bacterium]